MVRVNVPPPASVGPRPYNSAVIVNNTVYLAGHVGFVKGTRKVPPDIEEEIRLMMESLRDTMIRAGLTLTDLVMVQIYASDLSLYDQFNAVYVKYFERELPARAFLGCGSLVGGAHFEIVGIAAKP
jgi:2-iminobutanoate/2-iminopropanoate deaminase